MKYIDADKLKAKVKELNLATKTYEEQVAFNNALAMVMEIIDSLPEQPVLPGIDEEGIPGKDFIPVEWVDACERYGKWKIVKAEQPVGGLDKLPKED